MINSLGLWTKGQTGPFFVVFISHLRSSTTMENRTTNPQNHHIYQASRRAQLPQNMLPKNLCFSKNHQFRKVMSHNIMCTQNPYHFRNRTLSFPSSNSKAVLGFKAAAARAHRRASEARAVNSSWMCWGRIISGHVHIFFGRYVYKNVFAILGVMKFQFMCFWEEMLFFRLVVWSVGWRKLQITNINIWYIEISAG